MAAAGTYPVTVDARLDSPLSRWLWLVKWLLAIPHYIVLALLWLAFVVLSVVAFFAILFTGRYPQPIFEFNVGVLRWTWRVQYYTIGAFGTDRYPPFTLADDPSYPARLDVAYPGQLSRGLVLVKWWLLAIPHYLIVAVFTGGSLGVAGWFGYHHAQGFPVADWGLIGILAVIGAIVLLFTGTYPQQIFDFVLGMNRWVLRVAAYAGLMTDQYPPFRLDLGGHEPGGTLTVPPPSAPPASGQAPPEPPAGPMPPGRRPEGWTTSRVISAVIGAILVLGSLGLFGAGGTALWATTHRHQGYVNLGTATYSTSGYAIASDKAEIYSAGWDAARALFGTVRLRATPASAADRVFLGVAPSAKASRYLAGTGYATVTGPVAGHLTYRWHSGGAPATPPARAGIWAASVSGPGAQTLSWPARNGSWTVVAMNAAGTHPVTVRVAAAATLPALPWIATGLLIAGALALAGGVILILVPARRVSR